MASEKFKQVPHLAFLVAMTQLPSSKCPNKSQAKHQPISCLPLAAPLVNPSAKLLQGIFAKSAAGPIHELKNGEFHFGPKGVKCQKPRRLP